MLYVKEELMLDKLHKQLNCEVLRVLNDYIWKNGEEVKSLEYNPHKP